MKLIDKDALIAEIKKRYEYWREKEHNSHSIESEARMSECQYLVLLLNTIKVKEVDLEKEAEQFVQSEYFIYNKESPILLIAKHFFELGLSVNSHITAADRGKADEIILALNTLGEEKMISYDKEIEWLNKIKEL